MPSAWRRASEVERKLNAARETGEWDHAGDTNYEQGCWVGNQCIMMGIRGAEFQLLPRLPPGTAPPSPHGTGRADSGGRPAPNESASPSTPGCSVSGAAFSGALLGQGRAESIGSGAREGASAAMAGSSGGAGACGGVEPSSFAGDVPVVWHDAPTSLATASSPSRTPARAGADQSADAGARAIISERLEVSLGPQAWGGQPQLFTGGQPQLFTGESGYQTAVEQQQQQPCRAAGVRGATQPKRAPRGGQSLGGALGEALEAVALRVAPPPIHRAPPPLTAGSAPPVTAGSVRVTRPSSAPLRRPDAGGGQPSSVTPGHSHSQSPVTPGRGEYVPSSAGASGCGFGIDMSLDLSRSSQKDRERRQLLRERLEAAPSVGPATQPPPERPSAWRTARVEGARTAVPTAPPAAAAAAAALSACSSGAAAALSSCSSCARRMSRCVAECPLLRCGVRTRRQPEHVARATRVHGAESFARAARQRAYARNILSPCCTA